MRQIHVYPHPPPRARLLLPGVHAAPAGAGHRDHPLLPDDGDPAPRALLTDAVHLRAAEAVAIQGGARFVYAASAPQYRLNLLSIFFYLQAVSASSILHVQTREVPA